MNTTKAEVGVTVGRFQVPRLTAGHQYLLNYIVKTHPRALVFIGNTPLKGMANDPLTYQMRRAVVERAFPTVEVHRIDDIFDAEKWSVNLDQQIDYLTGPFQKVVLYGSRRSFLGQYRGKFPTEMVPELEGTCSATDIRRQIGTYPPKTTEEFLEGAVWLSQNQYPKVYATVDIAVVNVQTRTVLLGKRRNTSLWRFPGGFSDIISPSFESDALRELNEEFQIVGNEIEYIGSAFCDDPRYKSQRDKIKTLFFAVTDWEGLPIPSDDMAGGEVCITPIDSFNPNTLVPNHKMLWDMLQKWVAKKWA